MTEQEWRNQKNKARANWELLQMKQRAGVVTVEALAEAERVYKALVAYVLPSPEAPPTRTDTRPDPNTAASVEPTVDLPAMPVGEFTRLLEELTLQKSAFHKEMAIRCNRLKDIPDSVNAKELVDDIDDFYERRNAVAVKINYLKANGRLPEDLGNEAPVDPEELKLTFMANLPADKYELSKKLALLLPNLSKARTNLERAKDQTKKVHYGQKVAKLEMEAALIRSRMKGMD